MKITFCIPSKNNLRYLKSSINSIKTNSSMEHDIIVYIDADNDGTEEWLIENNITYLKNTDTKPRGIAFAYNRCIEAAKTHIVCMFHADMFMAKGFDKAILKYLKPHTVVSGTRIEPPLHPAGMEKIVENFGMYPEDFNEAEFNTHVWYLLNNYPKTTKGIFAPWAIYKEDITCIGMHDESFHSYHEDSDIFNRFVLNGYNLIQTWEAFVYHFTCRGGQFQDGVDQVTIDENFHIMKTNAAKNYVRKWGSWIKNNEYHYPIISKRYQKAFLVKNCNYNLIPLLEPWCDILYTHDELGINLASYYQVEQKNTIFNLKNKFKVIGRDLPIEDIIVEFDGNELNNNNFQILQNLQAIISESNELGIFELDIFKITINNLNTYQDKLVNLNDKYYKNQLLN